MFSEDNLLAISALQHYVFCPRRCALVHLEQTWGDNVFTAEGTHLHERTHEAATECRGDLIISRSLRIRSFRLGLVGMADVVEFHRGGIGIQLPGQEGLWQPFPVEYKRGILKDRIEYRIQLCAQAICLEEMLQTEVPRGALFYGKSKRRYDVELDMSLRERTEQAAAELHRLFDSGQTPTARYQKKCDCCSLYQQCLPKTTGVRKKVDAYMEKAFELSDGGLDE